MVYVIKLASIHFDFFIGFVIMNVCLYACDEVSNGNLHHSLDHSFLNEKIAIEI